MTWLAVVGASLQLMFLVFKKWFSLDKEQKEKLQEAQNEVTKGIKEGDISAITAGFDRANKLR